MGAAALSCAARVRAARLAEAAVARASADRAEAPRVCLALARASARTAALSPTAAAGFSCVARVRPDRAAVAAVARACAARAALPTQGPRVCVAPARASERTAAPSPMDAAGFSCAARVRLDRPAEAAGVRACAARAALPMRAPRVCVAPARGSERTAAPSLMGAAGSSCAARVRPDRPAEAAESRASAALRPVALARVRWRARTAAPSRMDAAGSSTAAPACPVRPAEP